MSFKFFSNKSCEYYPCHKMPKVSLCSEPDDMNCLFCFCPLYWDDDCGGSYKIIGNGVKDCSNCLLPHSKTGYDYIYKKIMKKF